MTSRKVGKLAKENAFKRWRFKKKSKKKKAITYETCNVLVDGAVESQCLNSGIKFLW